MPFALTYSILNSTSPLLLAGCIIIGEKASGLVLVLSSKIETVAPPVALTMVTIAFTLLATFKNRYFAPTL